MRPRRRLAGLRRRLAALQCRFAAVERRLDAALPGPVKVGALALYLHSTPDAGWLDRVAASSRWDQWADVAVGALLALQAGGLALVGVAAWRALEQSHATPLNDPVNTVAVPGFNEFMPLAVAPHVVAALVVATVVHEGGHAIACRRAGVRIREWGVALLFGVLPVAAYVLPGAELDSVSVRSRLRVYSIGAFHNLVVALAALAVLYSPLAASPTEAFVAYFGWALTGGAPPTATTVASLGALTNVCFWTALLNANFGLLNALPVWALDGGRVLALSLAAASDRTAVSIPARGQWFVVHVAGAVAVSLVVVAVVGPWLPL